MGAILVFRPPRARRGGRDRDALRRRPALLASNTRIADLDAVSILAGARRRRLTGGDTAWYALPHGEEIEARSHHDSVVRADRGAGATDGGGAALDAGDARRGGAAADGRTGAGGTTENGVKQEEMFSSRDDGTTGYQMRSPCPFCGGRNGKLSRSGAHWRVDCAPCDRYMYFAPVSEVEANRKTEDTP